MKTGALFDERLRRLSNRPSRCHLFRLFYQVEIRQQQLALSKTRAR
jgi:hypothetical protein